MKAYIKKSNDSSLFEQAKCGFIKMGYEIVMYDKLDKKVEADSVVVGYISDMLNIAKVMGFKNMPQIDYPSPLEKYLHRDIKVISRNELPNEYPYFIKPTCVKSFKGRVVRGFKDLIGVNGNEFYFTDTILDIVSEYRCFVLDGVVISAKHYKGNPYVGTKEYEIVVMVNSFTDSPSAYSLDIGITRDGTTVLIECNNAYSSGNYGMSDTMYAKFLRQGWIEILNMNNTY